MKVAELKQVVDANAVEMREGFAKVQVEFGKVREEMRTEFASVREEIADVRTEMRTEFADARSEMAALRQEIRDSASETMHQMRAYFENFENNVILAATAGIDERIDLKIAKAEVRIERRLDRKYGKH